MTVPTIRPSISLGDITSNPYPQENYRFAKITAIRVQDIARQIWYSWDDPPRAWNKTPEVQTGVNNMYVAFYAVNPHNATADIRLTLVSQITGKVLATKTFGAAPNTGIGLEWTGDANNDNSNLLLKAEILGLQPPTPAPTPEPTPTPTPTPTPIVIPVVEIPELPWYLSWLTPVLKYIAELTGSVMNYFVSYILPYFKPIADLAPTLLDIYTTVQQIGSPLTLLLPINTNKARDALANALAGNVPALLRLVDPEAWFVPGTSDHDVAAKLGDLRGETNTIVTTLNLIAFMAELASLGQVEAAQGFVESYLKMFPVQETVSKALTTQLEAAWIKPIQRQINAKWLPERPDVNELINEVVKEVITLDQFVDIMLGKGFAPVWSQRIWDAHFIQPNYQNLQFAYWRGFVKDDELDHYLKLWDLDPRYNDRIWKPLLKQIPPYQELVNERVKEVISQSTFAEGLAGWGFKGDWGKRIWDAHFIPASFIDFLTAMRRKQSVNIPVAEGTPVPHTFGADVPKDIDVVKQLSVLADYDPRYWDFFKTRIYNDPSPRMSMWAYDAGAIDDVQMREIVHRYGYTPDAEAWFGDMLIKFQERPWVTRYLTALQTAYIQEAITADELEARVIAIPRNKNIAGWMVKIADVRKEILAKAPSAEKLKLLSDSDLRKAYSWDKIDADKLRSELLLRGYSLADIEILIEVVNEEKQATIEGGMKKGLTIAELFDAMRYEFKTEEQVRTELMLRGMQMDDADVLIKTRKAKWVMGGQTAGGD